MEKTLIINSEWPSKPISECLIEGDKALAEKVDDAYSKLVEEFSENSSDVGITMENYAIVADDLGVTLISQKEQTDETEPNNKGDVAGEVEITRVNKVDIGHIKAFCDVAYSGLIIKGFRIIEGTEGTFVGFPAKENLLVN